MRILGQPVRGVPVTVFARDRSGRAFAVVADDCPGLLGIGIGRDPDERAARASALDTFLQALRLQLRSEARRA